MRARAVKSLPEGPHWRYEPKWDGVRAVATHRDDGRVVIASRSGRRLDPQFPEVAEAVAALLPEATTVDGEIVRWSGGSLDFDALLRRLRAVRTARRLAVNEPCHFVVFDVLRLRGADLARRSLAHRRHVLEELIAAVSGPSPLMLGWQTSDVEEARGWFDDLAAVGVEGLVVKDARASYRPGQRDWLKLKHRTTTESIVGAVTGPLTRPNTLVLGRYDPDGRLRIVGRTTDLSPEQSEVLGSLLRRAENHPWPPSIAAAWGSRERIHLVHVQPEIVVEVEPDVAVASGRWRHPVRYVRVRDEVHPSEVPHGIAG